MGHKVSSDARKKISETLIGHKHSSATLKKISDSNMGRKCSPTTLKKMSNSKLGENHNMAILTEEDVLDIQFFYKDELERRYHEGKQHVRKGFALELSEYYGVCASHISGIGHHRAWKYLDKLNKLQTH